MDKFLEVISTFNLPIVLVMGAIFWYFTRDIKAEMKHLEDRIDAKMDAQVARTDRLYEMFVSLQKETKDELMRAQKETKDIFIELLK